MIVSLCFLPAYYLNLKVY